MRELTMAVGMGVLTACISKAGATVDRITAGGLLGITTVGVIFALGSGIAKKAACGEGCVLG